MALSGIVPSAQVFVAALLDVIDVLVLVLVCRLRDDGCSGKCSQGCKDHARAKGSFLPRKAGGSLE